MTKTEKADGGIKYLILGSKRDSIKTVREPIGLFKLPFGSRQFVKLLSEHYNEDFKEDYKFYISSKKIKGEKLVYYGCDEMKTKRENKHELLHPVDEKLFFGNVYVFLCDVKKDKMRLIDLTKKKYEEFNERAVKGTRDLGSTDSDYSEECESIGSLKDFIVSDSETIDTYSDELSRVEEDAL